MNITNRKGTWCPMWLGKTVCSYSVYSVHSKLMCELYQIIRIWIASHFHLIGRESESERARDSALGKIRLIKKNYLRAYYVSALAENIWLIREKREETRNDRDRDRKNSMHISRNMIYLNICHKKGGPITMRMLSNGWWCDVGFISNVPPLYLPNDYYSHRTLSFIASN